MRTSSLRRAIVALLRGQSAAHDIVTYGGTPGGIAAAISPGRYTLLRLSSTCKSDWLHWVSSSATRSDRLILLSPLLSRKSPHYRSP